MVKKKRVVITRKHRFKHSCEEVFKMGCAAKEEEWLPGWKDHKENIYPENGLLELNCVFRNNRPHLMGTGVVVNNVYEPFEKLQWSGISENVVYQFQTDYKPMATGCEATLTQTWTALTPKAEEFLGKLEENAEREIGDFLKAMDHYLTTGKMLGS